MGFNINHAPEPLYDCCDTYDSRLVRRQIFSAWESSCCYCGSPGATTLDHLLPRYRGGISEPNNLAPCCSRCNQEKGSSLLEDWYPGHPGFSEERLDRINLWRSHPWI